jgi:hypothetical protein
MNKTTTSTATINQQGEDVKRGINKQSEVIRRGLPRV